MATWSWVLASATRPADRLREDEHRRWPRRSRRRPPAPGRPIEHRSGGSIPSSRAPEAGDEADQPEVGAQHRRAAEDAEHRDRLEEGAGAAGPSDRVTIVTSAKPRIAKQTDPIALSVPPWPSSDASPSRVVLVVEAVTRVLGRSRCRRHVRHGGGSSRCSASQASDAAKAARSRACSVAGRSAWCPACSSDRSTASAGPGCRGTRAPAASPRTGRARGPRCRAPGSAPRSTWAHSRSSCSA